MEEQWCYWCIMVWEEGGGGGREEGKVLVVVEHILAQKICNATVDLYSLVPLYFAKLTKCANSFCHCYCKYDSQKKKKIIPTLKAM